MAFLRKMLIPAALSYALAGAFHRNISLRPKLRNRRHLLPMVVIGALRAGGSGKTAVVLELARRFSAQGRRVGILAFAVHNNHRGGFGSQGVDPLEIHADGDWRQSSDEAVLLARESGARVFATRNRERAWDLLSRRGDLDFLISDDGLMDPRLFGSFRMILKRPEERPGPFNLLPAGPYRLTARALGRADCVVEGPEPSAIPGKYWFRRELIFPRGFEFPKPYWVLSGLGYPGAFEDDLSRQGVRVRGASRGRDHGLPDLRRAATRAAADGILCSAKDWIKLEARAAEIGPVSVIRERILLSPALMPRVEEYLEFRASS